MTEPLEPTRFAHNPILAAIIESGRNSRSTGITKNGQLSAQAQTAAAIIRDNRDREKMEIADLNNRLARYVEKVRFLEAQNRVLENDINVFRQAPRIHADRIVGYFESEKASLFAYVRDNKTKISIAETSIRKLEPEMIAARRSLESSSESRQRMREEKRNQMKVLSNIEAENTYIKRLATDCEEEKERVRVEISRLRNEIKRVNAQRDKERSHLLSTSQELMKRLNGSITQHEIAIRQEINTARRDTTDKNREYFHNELHVAMKEIREKFELDSRGARKTWEEWYHKKMLEIKKGSETYSTTEDYAREEILRIRIIVNEFRAKLSDAETINQQLVNRIESLHYQDKENLQFFEYAVHEKENSISKMREQCTKLSVELESLVDNQITLRNEISHYRKLMEKAEHRRVTAQNHVTFVTPADTFVTPTEGQRTISYHSYGSAYTTNVSSNSLL